MKKILIVFSQSMSSTVIASLRCTLSADRFLQAAYSYVNRFLHFAILQVRRFLEGGELGLPMAETNSLARSAIASISLTCWIKARRLMLDLVTFL